MVYATRMPRAGLIHSIFWCLFHPATDRLASLRASFYAIKGEQYHYIELGVFDQ
ncbi:protein of unknown function [Brevefilum fermentans]|uniref:Uncharacterized protein n=1 Tax=Candidatus Brevifilum fermentans TaxID=1986204 RepID=A0A1Y6K4U4_9CHLR|nr:protein of unknown function [Brevefilum fermentans]